MRYAARTWRVDAPDEERPQPADQKVGGADPKFSASDVVSLSRPVGHMMTGSLAGKQTHTYT